MSTHTPARWSIEGFILDTHRNERGFIISAGINDRGDGPERYVGNLMKATKEDAALIVRAVNNHEALVEALEACAGVISGNVMTKDALVVALSLARAALASATGGTK